MVEKSLNEKIVFKQAAAATPTQFAQSALTQGGVAIEFIKQVVTHIASNGAAHHHLFDLANRFGRVEVLRAHVNTVHDGMASEQAIGIFQIV